MRKLFPATAVMLLAMSVFAEEGLPPVPERRRAEGAHAEGSGATGSGLPAEARNAKVRPALHRSRATGAGPTLLQRTRIHIASLIRNAQNTAGGAETRALATELLKELTELESTASRGSAVAFREEQSAFFATFKTMEEEIFPDREDDDLAAFRSSATATLADIADALPILAPRNDTAALLADLADLQSRLQLVSDASKLSGWIARFDAFAGALLRHTVPADPTLLKDDIRTLLTNLSAYIRSLQEAKIGTGNMLSEVEALRMELESIETDEDIDAFLPKLETALTAVPRQSTVNNQ